MLDLLKKRDIKIEIKGENSLFEYQGVINMACVDAVKKAQLKYINGKATNIENMSVKDALTIQEKANKDIIKYFLKDSYDEYLNFVELNKESENIIEEYIVAAIQDNIIKLESDSDMGE